MYDYVAVFCFYVRIVIQAVRLAFMFYAYAVMHDYVAFLEYESRMFLRSETIWEEFANINVSSIESVTYFFLFHIPTHATHLVYEILHTFFVVTGQIVAYCAMLF